MRFVELICMLDTLSSLFDRLSTLFFAGICVLDAQILFLFVATTFLERHVMSCLASGYHGQVPRLPLIHSFLWASPHKLDWLGRTHRRKVAIFWWFGLLLDWHPSGYDRARDLCARNRRHVPAQVVRFLFCYQLRLERALWVKHGLVDVFLPLVSRFRLIIELIELWPPVSHQWVRSRAVDPSTRPRPGQLPALILWGFWWKQVFFEVVSLR